MLLLQLVAVAGFGVLIATLTTIAIQLAGSQQPQTVVAAGANTRPGQAATAAQSAAQAPDAALTARLNTIIAATSARVAVTVVDLGSRPNTRVDIGGSDLFDAASTYKLPLLMANAENIANGTYRPSDRICFKSSEAEDGWFDDYRDGSCFTRQTLALRAARYSDNTAGHMLVDNLGGGGALNTYARKRGAGKSAFFVPNQTCAADLAALLVNEASGGTGGQAAQSWLYPLLTKTAFEAGVPAGIPPGVTVVHKVGAIDSTVDDAALVEAPKGAYVVVVMTDLVGGDEAYALIARISSAVWAAEAA